MIQTLQRYSDKRIFFDLGSGSGIIGINILLYLKDSFVYFNDISESACNVLKINLKKYNLLKRAAFLCSDFLSIDPAIKQKIEVVVSNPPYIPFYESKMINNETYYEPTNALFCKDCLSLYKNIITFFHSKIIMLEINPTFSAALSEYGKIIKDVNGKDRILIVE